MNFHEYQAKELFAEVGIPVPAGKIARTADEARFQRRDVLAPLWEQHILPGTLFNILIRKPLNITD